MEGAFLIWDDLLRRLSTHQRKFLHVFVERLASTITQRTRPSAQHDAFREACYLWLRHILLSDMWVQTTRYDIDVLRSETMTSCVLNPNRWTGLLGHELIEGGDELYRDQWIPYFNDCQADPARIVERDEASTRR